MLKNRLALLGYLAIGFWGLLAGWDPSVLLRARETVAERSVIAFENYNCAKKEAGRMATVAFLSGAAGDASDAARFEFVIAQYVMVPTLLRSGYHGEEFAIARIPEQADLSVALQEHGLEFARGCGRGIYVLRRGSSK